LKISQNCKLISNYTAIMGDAESCEQQLRGFIRILREIKASFGYEICLIWVCRNGYDFKIALHQRMSHLVIVCYAATLKLVPFTYQDDYAYSSSIVTRFGRIRPNNTEIRVGRRIIRCNSICSIRPGHRCCYLYHRRLGDYSGEFW